MRKEAVGGGKAGAGKRRRFKLTDARGVRREMARVYAMLDGGEIDCEQAKTRGFLLRCMLESLRVDELEGRIAALEVGAVAERSYAGLRRFPAAEVVRSPARTGKTRQRPGKRPCRGFWGRG